MDKKAVRSSQGNEKEVSSIKNIVGEYFKKLGDALMQSDSDYLADSLLRCSLEHAASFSNVKANIRQDDDREETKNSMPEKHFSNGVECSR